MNKLAQVARTSTLILLALITMPVTVFAQSLESLEREGLITPRMRLFLEEKKAFTPEKREEVLNRACGGGGELSPQECKSVSRNRYHYNHQY